MFSLYFISNHGGAIPATASSYDYDAIEHFVTDRNIESEAQNLQDCCRVSLNGDLRKKAQPGSLFAFADDFFVTKGTSKEITKSSRKRVKRLVKDLSDNSRQNSGLSQEKLINWEGLLKKPVAR